MNLAEFKQQNPDYAQVPDAELAEALHRKYYADKMPFDEFSRQVGVSRAQDVPGAPAPSAPAETPKKPGFLARRAGDVEAALSLATGAGATFLGAGAGLAGGVRRLVTGDKEGASPDDVLRGVQQDFTYQPVTEEGQNRLRTVADFFGASKLAGLGPTEAVTTGAMVSPVVTQARGAATAGAARVADLMRPEPKAIVGMGSAMVPQEIQRQARAGSLPVPIELTKGQATRDFSQQKFERETAKTAPGGPLRERFADQTERIPMNFDAWVDDVGAQAPDLRATGQVVTQAIAEKMNKAKGRVNAAYEEARKSGAMEAPVSVESLLDYARKNNAASQNTGVISTLETAINDITGPQRKDVFGQPIPRQISINDLEEIRKTIGTAGLKDDTSAHYAKEIKGVIDGLTENVGGEEYKRARRLHMNLKAEFENVGTVDKLMRTKPGTTDRAVAYEDVFKHSVLSGSLDDVRMIRKTLQTAGPNGEQAWKELQGQTLNYLKEAAIGGSQKDARGNPVISYAGLNKAVKGMDVDGKLDFMFGKQGAQMLRDIRDLSADVVTSPPGSVNFSNTGSMLMEAFGSMAMGKLPTAMAQTANAARKFYGGRKTRQQVQEALNP